ncbi:NAD(P)/FAD-dependent oxidoreductase [Actinocrispum wychmicini]|uniref:Thioredoxin reductase n=1 Tax=Actinocrispum wychmicini TaxID=1213861 RepID=A0A4R2JR29_9PSEU|nr:NAD(P)/FAD-dependent oxidoreductase [Actinocrispum wychmicini]TCO61924.1 thioredoxin reductase [Actinocrispum wychmicini]
MIDVLVVGGGAAGTAAALTLARMRRTVTVVDSGEGRNEQSHHLHGYPGFDGVPPAAFREKCLQELKNYPDLSLTSDTVASIEWDDHFRATLHTGQLILARRLLLATGLRDLLPDIPGVAEAWGSGVYHCPQCHGWELRDRPIMVLGGRRAAHLVTRLARFSQDVTWITSADTPPRPAGVRIVAGTVARVDGAVGEVHAHLADGRTIAAEGMFVTPVQEQRSSFAEQLGCTFLPDGRVVVNQFGYTGVDGVYAAGDMARMTATRYQAATVLNSAAAGAQAGSGVDQELTQADLGTPPDAQA